MAKKEKISVRKQLRNVTPESVFPTVIYVGGSLGSQFKVKDKTGFHLLWYLPRTQQ